MNQSETGNTIDNLDFSNIDFDKLEDVTQCAAAICQAASDSGMFASAYPMGPEFGQIRLSARKWLREVDDRLNKSSPAEALEAIGSYDIIHRIGYGAPACPDTVNKHVLRAFDAMIHGDRSVDEYVLFRYISAGLKRCDSVYFDRPLEWHSLCLDRWHKQFRYGTCLEKLSEYDITQRVSILLASDLWAFETSNESAYKKCLFEANKHMLSTLSRVRS